jgi:hypothetical protein
MKPVILLSSLLFLCFLTVTAAAQTAAAITPDDFAVFVAMAKDGYHAWGAGAVLGALASVLSVLAVVARYTVQLLKTVTLQKWLHYSWDALSNVAKMGISFGTTFVLSFCTGLVTALAAGALLKTAAWAALMGAIAAAIPVGLGAMGYHGAASGLKEDKQNKTDAAKQPIALANDATPTKP